MNFFISLLANSSNRKLSLFYYFLVLLILVLIIWAHVFKLDSIPPGIFFDESSIGYEASLISLTGLEQYGGEIPIYFKSAADYDSPILIYTTALIFRIFGISEYTLRLTNALFFFIALTTAIFLTKNIFKANQAVWIYLLISFGFLPQFFTSSRLSFEVISQLTFITAISLSVWWTFHQDDISKQKYIKATICGFIIGLSTYTYSTASILSILTFISVWVIYLENKNIKKLIYISSTFLISLIPYVIFNFNNPDALTSRFRGVSYIYEPISLAEKIGIFFSNYFAHWSPSFLILHGDTNLRHATGVGGMVYFVVLILFITGLMGIVFRNGWDKFKIFLIFNLLASPIAAALTSEGTPHSLRSFLLGYYILIISCYGLKYILDINTNWARIASLICIFTFLVCEVVNYQVDYFIYYPARSVDAMGSYDLRGAFEFAITEGPKEIVLLNNFAGGTENFQFYKYIVSNPDNISIKIKLMAIPLQNICIVYRRTSGVQEQLDKYSIPYTEFGSRYKPTELEKRFGAQPFFGVMKTRCYKDNN